MNLGRRHIGNLSHQRQSPLPQLIEFVRARFGRIMFRLDKSPAEPEGYPSGLLPRPRNIFPLCPEADSGYRFMPARSSTAPPLDLVQIDQAQMDIVVVDEETRQSVARPRLTGRRRGLSVRVGLDADAEPSSPSTST